ncbi:MAG: hypothetical protein KA715_11485 [Xanthomonadaceae bacterium]|nr:hypothetical protein [Xanthomonadaceae bacterium]
MQKKSAIQLAALIGVLTIAYLFYRSQFTSDLATATLQKSDKGSKNLTEHSNFNLTRPSQTSVQKKVVLPREQTEALVKQAMKEQNICKLMSALDTGGVDSNGDIDFLLLHVFEDKTDYELARAIRSGDIGKLRAIMKQPYQSRTPFLIGLCMAGLITDSTRVGCGEFQNKTSDELKEADAMLGVSINETHKKWMTMLYQALIRTKLNAPKSEIINLITQAFTLEGTHTEHEQFVGSIAAEMGKSITADYAKSSYLTSMFMPNFKPVYDFLREGMDNWDRELVTLIAEKSNRLLHTYLSKQPPVCCTITAAYFYGILQKALEKIHASRLALSISKEELYDRATNAETHAINDTGSTLAFLFFIGEMNEKTNQTEKCDPTQVNKAWNEIKDNFDDGVRREMMRNGFDWYRQ